MHGTADFLARLPVDGVKLHLLYVVRGTPLEALYASGAYRCLEQEAYAGLVCDVLERLPPEVVIQRLTGDPHPEELVAPAWSLRKQETLTRIRQTLERRGTRQGSRWSPPPAGG
jgi:radical SAM superfamily enzyme